jgi:hypothetical protein
VNDKGALEDDSAPLPHFQHWFCTFIYLDYKDREMQLFYFSIKEYLDESGYHGEFILL